MIHEIGVVSNNPNDPQRQIFCDVLQAEYHGYYFFVEVLEPKKLGLVTPIGPGCGPAA